MGCLRVAIRLANGSRAIIALLVFAALLSWCAGPRLHADNGDLDPHFGSGGKVTTRFFQYSQNEATAIAIQVDGKVVVAGEVVRDRVNADDLVVGFGVARYNPDGSLDSSFGREG